MPEIKSPEYRIALGEVLDVARAAELYARLKEGLVASGSIVLDASRMSQIDAAGVQLLAAFLETARRDGCDVQWLNPSQALHKAVRLLGLTDFFALQPTATAP
jgi:anti-anti-sigma regulatory factor